MPQCLIFRSVDGRDQLTYYQLLWNFLFYFMTLQKISNNSMFKINIIIETRFGKN